MLPGHLALIVAALFTGAAAYINIVEHPARMMLDESASLAQWKPSYKRGFAMQASLALLGGALGLWAWFSTDDVRWLIGAVVLVANWPYTMLAIMPTNRRLMQMSPGAVAGSRDLLARWGRLHAMRSMLGAIAMLIFLSALD